MDAFNRITGAVFDLLLAPWGHGLALLDISLWGVLCGVLALWIYRLVSNQEGIARAKDRIKMHLIEVRLWRDDPRVVAGAFGRILMRNGQYVGFSLVPMVVLAAPFMIVMFHLVAHFAFEPLPVGQTTLLQVQLDPATGARALDVELSLGDGVSLDAPPVRTADGRVVWRLRADAPGTHTVTLAHGAHRITKQILVAAEPGKVPVLRSKSWDALLYPGEAVLPADSPFASVAIDVPRRSFPWAPAGELGVSAWYLLTSLAAGFALKDVMGVRI